MKLDVDLSALLAAVQRMGGPLRDWELPDLNTAQLDPIDIELAEGLEIELKDLAFDNGYMVALLLGKDFGFVRVEAEHGMFHYDKARGRGFAEIHPTTLRVIIDKEFTDRLDFRFGIGGGVDLAKIRDEGKNYGRVSFCYDFLTGLGVRLNDGLALNLDYRFFLTAATDDYKRLQNHFLTAQFQFDL